MNKNASFGGLLALISNPTVLAIAGIGAAVLTVMEILDGVDDKKGSGSEAAPNGSVPLPEPLEGAELAVPATVVEPCETVEITAKSAVEDRYIDDTTDDDTSDQQQSETVGEEAAKKELIRQAMSELGKRSAAARAKKKSNVQE